MTGANSGIGLVAARELARKGASVTLGCRNLQKGRKAAGTIDADVEVRELDLASLASVRAFCTGWDRPLDLLINNAGIMAPPYAKTVDGFESQLATNHLGHFALTAGLLDALQAGDAPRVVNISSGAHRMGKMRWEDLQWEEGYSAWKAYGQSKLANLLFTFELQRRADGAGSAVKAVAAHPGYSATELQKTGGNVLQDGLMMVLNKVVAQSAEAGALPTLYAATEELMGASYVGPDGPGEMRGRPHLVGCSDRASNAQDAARLWTVSEELTGATFAWGAATPA